MKIFPSGMIVNNRTLFFPLTPSQVYELVPNEDAARGAGGAVAAKELPKGANLSRRAAMR